MILVGYLHVFFLFFHPETVPVRTVNRQCSSGLQAVADVAAAIKAGFYDIGISCITLFCTSCDCNNLVYCFLPLTIFV
jgi:hypothetical protein